MPQIINTNIMSLNSQRNLSASASSLATSLQRLSSGLRINSAKDDAAGLYTVETLTADVRGQNQAIRNAADGISLGQVAEGALAQIANNLQRIREIAVQAANGTVENRAGLQAEVTELQAENNRIVSNTKFNSVSLLNASGTITFQVGEDANQTITVNALSVSGTGITSTADVSSSGAASTLLNTMDTQIAAIAINRATFGAVQNRFEAAIANLSVSVENLSAARSRIQDADFAAETARLTRAQILQQAGVAMLAQANTAPQAALALLR